ncbi:MAG TPA: PorT family protein [Bacteroidales bacterium]|nr:PorT family protein [Bacteroidales bacterium]
MRRPSSVFFLLFLISLTHLSAQSFKGGLKGGLVASEVSGDHLAGPNKFGFFGSAFTMYPIAEHSYLQMEVMYIQKGSRSVPKDENQYFDYRFSLQYLEVPLLFVQDIGAWSLFLEGLLLHGGFSISKLIAYDETENGASIVSPINSNYKAMEANLLLGFSYPLSNSLYATFGYSNSLTPIRPHASGQSTWKNHGQYNSVWTLGFSYIIW